MTVRAVSSAAERLPQTGSIHDLCLDGIPCGEGYAPGNGPVKQGQGRIALCLVQGPAFRRAQAGSLTSVGSNAGYIPAADSCYEQAVLWAASEGATNGTSANVLSIQAKCCVDNEVTLC